MAEARGTGKGHEAALGMFPVAQVVTINNGPCLPTHIDQAISGGALDTLQPFEMRQPLYPFGPNDTRLPPFF